MTPKSETSGATQSADQEGYTQTFTMVTMSVAMASQVRDEWGNTVNISGRLYPDIYNGGQWPTTRRRTRLSCYRPGTNTGAVSATSPTTTTRTHRLSKVYDEHQLDMYGLRMQEEHTVMDLNPSQGSHNCK